MGDEDDLPLTSWLRSFEVTNTPPVAKDKSAFERGVRRVLFRKGVAMSEADELSAAMDQTTRRD